MTQKQYNDHFIDTINNDDYEVTIPPFFADEANARTLFDALDVGLHEDFLDEFEIDAVHHMLKVTYPKLDTTALMDDSCITATARALYRLSELFPESKAEELLENFRAYVNRNRRVIFPGG